MNQGHISAAAALPPSLPVLFTTMQHVTGSVSFDIYASPGPTAVVAVSFKGLPADADWPVYERAYRQLYAQHRRFIMVFDTRNIDFPTLEVLQNKKNLLQRLKHRTTGQVSATVILTQFDLIKQLVLTVLKAGGQAAPFIISTDMAEVTRYTANVVRAVAGEGIPQWLASRPGLTTMKDAGLAAVLALVLQQFVIFMRHFVRHHFAPLSP